MTHKEQLNELYKGCGLVREDVHQHKHYTIINRKGIEKIQFSKGITVKYEVVQCTPDFCVVKAIGTVIVSTLSAETVDTFGSAKYGGWAKNADGKNVQTGTTEQWYVMEMAEKRALSRVVLKITKGYQLGVFGEDEAPEFKQDQTK